MTEILEMFHPVTSAWFQRSIGIPTKVQEEAWPYIKNNQNTLVSAPTGTGKTLSAFLVFIDRLMEMEKDGVLENTLYLIYVSPLKSLAGDIRENLKKPISGLGMENKIQVAIRTGDTTQSDRRKMVKTPPHILITTPESLYLLLTSKTGQQMLKTAKTIILDELHALIDTKRGAHLMLSIARLDRLCGKHLQRIGLSATVEPLQLAANYLSPDEVAIVAPKMTKKIDLVVTSPLSEKDPLKKEPIWEEIGKLVYEQCKVNQSVIAFVDGRAYAEKLSFYVNKHGGEDFSRTHHGSLSKEQRFDVEESLRRGELKLLCATSSMELGIDVGEIDLVLQIGCPSSISSTMQRLGRAGHNPGRTSRMYFLPRTAVEGLYCGLTAEVVRQGGIEHSKPPRKCLDVLAQHLVSMAAYDSYTLDDVMELLSRAYPFYGVTREELKGVLCMLSGDYEHERDIPIRPRVLYDRIHECVESDAYSRMLAVSAGGTIPDKGMFSAKTETGVKLGELEEEFVFEARVGDKFYLGSMPWKILKIQKDSVIVAPTSSTGAKPPFWKGDPKGRKLQTGTAFGQVFRRLYDAYQQETLQEEIEKLGLDATASQDAYDLIHRQIKATGILPNDKAMLVEHFKDENGNQQIMFHSVFGRQVNEPLAILLAQVANKHTSVNISYVADDDGVLLFPYEAYEFPEKMIYEIEPLDTRKIFEAILPTTTVFNIAFRYNLGRSLMLGMKKAGRQPLWVQRLRSTEVLDSVITCENHPLIQETKRECLEDYWDLDGVEYVLHGIFSGEIYVHETYAEIPSPLSFLLRQQTEAKMMYDYAPSTLKIQRSSNDALKELTLVPPSLKELENTSVRNKLPKDKRELHTLLMIEGDLVAGELDLPLEWMEELIKDDKVCYIEPGLWIAKEQEKEYESALLYTDQAARQHIIRRLLRYRGGKFPEEIIDRYVWTEGEVFDVLTSLLEAKLIVEQEGIYYHSEVFDRARHATIKAYRSEITTLPSERYAALLASRVVITAPKKEQVKFAIQQFIDMPYSPEDWEEILLPARVHDYHGELLETILSEGDICWRMTEDKKISFHNTEDIDWECELIQPEGLLEKEAVIYQALLQRGATFMQRLTSLLGGESPYETMLGLVEKGLVCADSFMPIRQWLNLDQQKKVAVKQQVKVRAKAMTTGRYEVTRPMKEPSVEEILEGVFRQVLILSKETIRGISWMRALEILRVWEYTGRVRRGYFIEGMSGVQFIREKDFASVMAFLKSPTTNIVWLNAVDPAQPWGKCLPHQKDRAFMNVPGTAVALAAGKVIAVFEKQGKILRVFEMERMKEALKEFATAYRTGRIYPLKKRITVKEYPKEVEDFFVSSGFIREMNDFTMYH